MEYHKIIAVTGLPGLYELISSKGDGAVVRSLDDKSTKFVSSRVHNFSHLESIEIYTQRDNVNLVEIFKAMESSSTSLPDDKDPKAVKSYFENVYPDLDFDRVYNSDMKKMIKWFDVLKTNNIEIKLPDPVAEEPAPVVEEQEEKEEKPKKTAKKKEEKPVKAEKTEKKAAEKPAAKKAAPKAKKEDTKESKPEKKAAPKKAAKPASGKSASKKSK